MTGNRTGSCEGMEMMMRKLILLAVAVPTLALAGCQDLDIVNHNAPDRRSAMAEPGDVEALISSAYRLWWVSAHHSEPNRALSVMGNEMTSALTGSAVY